MGISREQALDCFKSDDLIGIGMEADAIRRRLHPEGVVSYIIDRNINYTNFCTEYCTFCAFYRPLKGKMASEGYILDFETIYQKIAETVEMGGTGVLMQGGLHPDLKIDWFENLFRGIRERFPSIWLHCLSASEILAIAEYSELSLRDTIMRLRDAGLQSIPGGGAEILDDDVRHRIARLKCKTQDWVDVHRTAHELGMRTTATMMFGVGETFEQRINHFEVVRNLQEETGGFTAFIPWSFQPNNTALGGRGWTRPPRLNTSKPWPSRGCTSTTSRMYSPAGSRRASKSCRWACASAETTSARSCLKRMSSKLQALQTAPPKRSCAASSVTLDSNQCNGTRSTGQCS